jgi:hypothetical protein
VVLLVLATRLLLIPLLWLLIRMLRQLHQSLASGFAVAVNNIPLLRQNTENYSVV